MKVFRDLVIVAGVVVPILGVIELARGHAGGRELIGLGGLCLLVGLIWRQVDAKKHADDGPALRLVRDESPELFIAKIPDLAEQHVAMVREIMGETIQYDAFGFATTDRLIDVAWGGNTPEQIDPVIASMGSYVGETIRRTFGGRWVYSEVHGPYLDDLGNAGATLFPFVKTRKRLEIGHGHTLAAYYEGVLNAVSR